MTAKLLCILLLCVSLPGCSSMGLALAEDLTRITGELTNQQQTATKLADQLAQVREARERQEAALASKVADVAQLATKASAGLTDLSMEVNDATAETAVGGVAIVLANLLMVYLQGNLRNKSRGTLVGSIMEAVVREIRGNGSPQRPEKTK